LHCRLGVLVLEEELDAGLGTRLGGLRDPLDEPAPGRRVGRLEGVVVALDAGPDDQVRAEGAGELGRLAKEPPGLGTRRVVRRDEAAAPEPGVEVKAAGDA